MQIANACITFLFATIYPHRTLLELYIKINMKRTKRKIKQIIEHETSNKIKSRTERKYVQ